MSESPRQFEKQAIDKDLSKIGRLEDAGRSQIRRLAVPSLGVLAGLVCMLIIALTTGWNLESALVATAILLGLYMGLSIGANDVANNVGPAVGAQAMTMTTALLMAATFEISGALIAGGEVVETIRGDIINAELMPSSHALVLTMLAALLSAALWVHCATYLRAPVSTTHSVIGGILGAAIAAAGFSAVNWNIVAAVTSSWMVSPLLGGLVGALLQLLVMDRILERQNKIAAARFWVPLLLAIMACAFINYLILKGFTHLWQPQPGTLTLTTVLLFAGTYALCRPLIHFQSKPLENSKRSVRQLFRFPLLVAAALLSFAHGANDIANAIGPVAAILETVQTGRISTTSTVPFWVLVLGALGISSGLLLFGRRLVRLVGHEITRMNPIRAFCIALAATSTVLLASTLGLPVSTTHITIGALFGVGFAREFRTAFQRGSRLKSKSLQSKTANGTASGTADKFQLQAYQRRKLVRRSHILTISTAWVITVPLTALLSAFIFAVLSALSISV
ncbi:inorganic phosphate transporter [Coralliovum pocilloporae]|uniref:inorganic phosphate transporter n=1 Tax=Coralliovum pocilloporae TaxID=3066369 RepID=UPI0033073A18